MSTRTRIAAGLATATVLTGMACATAQAMPTEHHATITMVIANTTDSTMIYDGGLTPGGRWLTGPDRTIPAHASRSVSVNAVNGIDGVGAQLDYHLSGISLAPRGNVTLTANDYPSGTTVNGTRATDRLHVDAQVNGHYPQSSFTYTVRG